MRDLTADVLLACHLANEKCRVVLSPFNNSPFETFRFSPDYLLVNCVRKTNDVFLDRVRKSGIPFGALDTEGGVFVKMEDEGGKPNFIKTLSQNEKVLNGLEDYFVWGRSLFDYLHQHGPFLSSSLRLTGTPRTDVFHPSWTGEKPERTIVLINTSFTLVNPKYQSSKEEAESLINDFGFNRTQVYEALEKQENLIKEFLDTIDELVQRFPEQVFVLRPHPFEGLGIYTDKFNGLKNIKVSSENTVDYWLRRLKALVHFECSTALEAALLGIPAFSLKQFRDLRPIEAVSAVTNYCESRQDLFNKIELCILDRFQHPPAFHSQVHQVIESVYFSNDGLASQRITAQILKRRNLPEEAHTPVVFFWWLFYLLTNTAKLAMGRTLVKESKRFNAKNCLGILEYFKQANMVFFSDINIIQRGCSVILEKRLQ